MARSNVNAVQSSVVTGNSPVVPAPLDAYQKADNGLAMEIPLVEAAPLIGSVVPAKQSLDVPKVLRCRVLATKAIAVKGWVYTIHAGQIVDSNNYDLEDLRKQGVVLQDVE